MKYQNQTFFILRIKLPRNYYSFLSEFLWNNISLYFSKNIYFQKKLYITYKKLHTFFYKNIIDIVFNKQTIYFPKLYMFYIKAIYFYKQLYIKKRISFKHIFFIKNNYKLQKNDILFQKYIYCLQKNLYSIQGVPIPFHHQDQTPKELLLVFCRHEQNP